MCFTFKEQIPYREGSPLTTPPLWGVFGGASEEEEGKDSDFVFSFTEYVSLEH